MVRWAFLLMLLLAFPQASAFSTTQQDLRIAYGADTSPVVVGAGELALEGTLTGGLFLGGSRETTLSGIGHLVILDRNDNGTVRGDFHDVILEIEEGALMWRFNDGTLGIKVHAPYGVGLALPQAPIPAEPGEAPPAGFLLAGERILTSAQWTGRSVTLVPLDAVITVRDKSGQPLTSEWDGRRVNQGARSIADTQGGGGLEVVFRAEGNFAAKIDAAILAGATGLDADLAMRVARAPVDSYAATVALLDRTSESFAGESGPNFAGQGSPLQVLEQASGILNGALVVVPGDGSTSAGDPLVARWGEKKFAVGAFNVIRGDDLGVAWTDGEMRIAGTPTVALGRDGFAVDPPIALGIFPIVSIVLWLVAIASVIFYFVKRPPKGHPAVSLRLASIMVYAFALLVALFLWDRSFAQTFGTGVVDIISERGLNAGTIPQIGVTAMLELVPWGIASFLFALPVRIALGVALRYLGRGKSFKGVATAGGLLVLAVLGPIYALWCFNFAWASASRMIAGG